MPCGFGGGGSLPEANARPGELHRTGKGLLARRPVRAALARELIAVAGRRLLNASSVLGRASGGSEADARTPPRAFEVYRGLACSISPRAPFKADVAASPFYGQ